MRSSNPFPDDIHSAKNRPSNKKIREIDSQLDEEIRQSHLMSSDKQVVLTKLEEPHNRIH